jgi:hypothetical protein
MTIEQSPRMRDLIQAGQNRRLTDAERLELAAMTWTGDEALELARLVKVRHPDEVHRLPLGTQTELDSYEQRRARAIAGGRTVPELGPDVALRIDAAIGVLRETDAPPAELANVDEVRRQAFAEALDGGSIDAAIAIYREWIADLARVDLFYARRLRARATIGLGSDRASDRAPRPSLVRELDRWGQAQGGIAAFGRPI